MRRRRSAPPTAPTQRPTTRSTPAPIRRPMAVPATPPCRRQPPPRPARSPTRRQRRPTPTRRLRRTSSGERHRNAKREGLWLSRFALRLFWRSMKEFYIADAARFDNEYVTSYFAISSLQVRERKQGGQYLALTLSDKTGTFEARMWEEFAETLAS